MSRNKSKVTTDRSHCINVKKSNETLGNFCVATRNRFDILAELDDETYSEIEQGVEVNDITPSKCKVKDKEIMCKHVEVSQLQD